MLQPEGLKMLHKLHPQIMHKMGTKQSTIKLMHHMTFSTKESVRALSSEVVSILSSDLFHNFQVGLPMPIVAKTQCIRDLSWFCCLYDLYLG